MLAQLTAAGLASGDSSGNAQNALKLGGTAAANFPQISSGTWTPTLYGDTTAGPPTYTKQSRTWWEIGKLVIINIALIITSKGGMAGTGCIGGLPFIIAGYGLLSYQGISVADGFVNRKASAIQLVDAANINDNFAVWASSGYYICS